MGTEVVLTNVAIMQLREKIAGYTLLFGRQPALQVSGSFYDQEERLLVLSRDFYEVKVESTMNRYLSLLVKGEWFDLTPVAGTLARVKFY